ncbi:lysylphosphatidylglycerol synthase domain-containing protein [Pseudomonas sp. GOM7]|uniref:lysylphosphatidylglycerol synthase domain-containing protein n=1 Tax=Pseudomonas sp. GOM7 TaxID=2998079 RepID=UPI00227CE0BC|nr:lysylphosphatidylglycerol synthase domain-containing protein [Pseudomonas sp. GOM7]WAJ35835.1 lysylphosphatidylglycerol synthase domain-containing protein [Pseudomonas sp. GOM7]
MILIAFVFYFVDFDKFLASLFSFPLTTVVGVFLLFLLNFVVVTIRYWRVLKHFGYAVGFVDVVKANVSGSIASLLMIPLLGQVAGRHVMLERAGVSAVENAAIAFYERFVVGSLSGVLALLGGFFIFSSEVVDYVKDVPLFEVSLIFLLSISSYFYWVASRAEGVVIKRVFAWGAVLSFLEVYALSLLANILVLLSFFTVFSVVLPDVNALSVLSVAAIVSFLAGLPVSFGGWGLREVSSISLISLLGGAAASALAASVLLGFVSIAAVLVLFPVLIIKRKFQEAKVGLSSMIRSSSVLGLEEIAVWILTLMVGGLIFFQVHVQIGEGYLNVNLADPFAVLIFSVVMLNLFLKRELPQWRVSWLNVYLLLISLAFVGAYLHGYLSFGSTAWASGKLVGWLVLLGYLFCGYMVVRYFRMSGFFRLSKFMVVSLVLVLVVSIVKWFLSVHGLLRFEGFSYILEAYSGNRNALAFQVLMVLALVLAFEPWYLRRPLKLAGFDVLFFAVAVMVTAILITASRSATIVLAMVFLYAFYFGVARRKFLVGSFLLGGVGFLVAQYGPYVWGLCEYYLLYVYHLIVSLFSSGGEGAPDFSAGISAIALPVSSQESDSLRLTLLTASFDMWLKNPLFGAGLGAFYHESSELLGIDVIIHNTALWILAEFGVVGFALFAAPFICIFKYALSGCGLRVVRNALIMLFLVFAAMSLFHEVFYQRIFWVFLGACIAVPRVSSREV